MSPAELLLGRKPRSRLDLVYPEMGRKVRLRQCVQKEKHDLHVKKRIVKKGDEVYARNFCQGPKLMPGIVQQSNGPISFEVELEYGRKWRRHQDHLIQRASYPQMLTETPTEQPETPLPESDEAETVIRIDENDANGQGIKTPAVPLVTDVPKGPDASERRYPVRNRRRPQYLGDFVLSYLG